LGLKSAPKKEHCPYNEPPDIQLVADSWTINDTPREKADPSLCALIIANADACATCPLADLKDEPQEPPSLLFQHLVFLADAQAIGVRFSYSELSRIELEGLKVLKRKRDEKTARDLKQK